MSFLNEQLESYSNISLVQFSREIVVNCKLIFFYSPLRQYFHSFICPFMYPSTNPPSLSRSLINYFLCVLLVSTLYAFIYDIVNFIIRGSRIDRFYNHRYQTVRTVYIV